MFSNYKMLKTVKKTGIPVKQTGEVSNWSHKDCDEKIYLRGNSYLYCEGYETQDHFLDWKFNCGVHNGKYMSPKFNAVVLALSSSYSINQRGYIR